MNASKSIQIELLGKDNYDTWRIQAMALLIKNDAWEYVNGTKRKPATTATAAEISSWETADIKARSDLILLMQPSQLKSIKSCATSHELWLKLESIHQSKGPARKATLLKQLTLNRMQEGQDVREHIARFFDAVDKLQSMDIEINQDLLAILLLYSLPGSFEYFRCAIEARDELPTPEMLKIKIIEEYDARKESANGSMQKALFAGKGFNKHSKFKTRKFPTENLEKREPKEMFKFKCHYCRKIGHKMSECELKRKGTRYNANNVEENSLLAITEKVNAALTAEEGTLNTNWCLDSGCTSHMCRDEKRFASLHSSEFNKLNLANNAHTEVKGKGTVKISVMSGIKEKTFNLLETLHVPDLRTNLLSVTRITDKGGKVIFKKDVAEIIDRNGNIMMIANRRNDLYYVEEKVESARTTELHTSKLMTWHRRYGHLNEKDLKEIIRKELAIGIDFNKDEQLPLCETCVKGKLTRSSFPKNSERNTKMLDIVHTDICGPMRTQSWGGAKYFMVLIDDCTRWCEVRFLKRKSDALSEFKKYKNWVENQTGMRIKCIQSDNGKEYCNREFDEYLKECGIQRRLTITHTPEQNGIAERHNRTLVEMARCLLLQSNLSPAFWAEAINTANHIRNRCPSRSLNGNTPFMKWTGKRPVVSYFRTFGCRAYTLDRNPTKGKMDSRSRECIFVGYSLESKGYRVWIPEERRIEVTRDIRFLDEFRKDFVYEEFLNCDNDNNNNLNNIKTKESESLEDKQYTDIHWQPIDEKDRNYLDEQQQNNEEEETEEEELEEEENRAAQNDASNEEVTPMRRGRGRPQIVRDGSRGRPKKVYQYVDARISEQIIDTEVGGNSVEIPVKIALSSNNKLEWKEAIKEEYMALVKNNAWVIVDRPKECNLIDCRIVLRNKCGPEGIILKRKARLVARGFNQRPGVDFNETFAPVARMSSIRMIMALAAKNNLKVHHLDVSTAFLNGEINEKLYMQIPEYLEETLQEILNEKENKLDAITCNRIRKMLHDIRTEGKVCLLKKALYGLRQSSRQWNLKFDEKLKELGLTKSLYDPCVYYAKRNKDLMIVAIYVDDMIVATGNLEWMAKFKEDIMSEFDMKDLGKIKHCLGIEFIHSKGKIWMTQKGYIENILNRFGMLDCKSVTTPCDSNQRLFRKEETTMENMKRYPYRELIGSLMYLSVATRPDISFAASHLSQFNDNYREEHWISAKRVLRYLKGTINNSICFRKDDSDIKGFVDADWGSCKEDRRSYTGFLFMYGGGPICWESRKQRTVALSSTEAEYMALTECCKEAIYLQGFLKELGIRDCREITILNDNQGAHKLAMNPIYHRRTKHVDVKYHFIRQALEEKKVAVEYIPTNYMTADVLTKGLSTQKHKRCIEAMEIGPIRSINTIAD